MEAPAPGCLAPETLEGIALGRQSAEFDTHLSICVQCRRAVERIRANNRFLSQFAIDGALPAAPPPTAQFEVQIQGYEIRREIHRGGQGIVYQARQLATRRDVAIKVMKQGPFATLADRGRFEREIDTLGRLNHPNIVAVHDAGVASGFHYFVMNYIDGATLDEALVGEHGASRPETGLVLEKFIKVCDAVNAAHLRGVIHRDLKPSNIRVDREGEPHVLDFGLAKTLENDADTAMTRTGQFVGSLPWASPEQLEGASNRIDLRTDVYSLGAILYQLLTGRLPFDVGSNLRAAFDSILNRDPAAPSSIVRAAGGPRLDDELDTIVLKCLTKDRERRYQSAGELARDLRRYLNGEPIEAKRDSALYVIRKLLVRYRLRATAAALAVVMLGVFAVVMSILYQKSQEMEHSVRASATSLAAMLSRSNIEQGRMAGLLGNLPQAEILIWSELLTRRLADGRFTISEPPGRADARWAAWELYRRFPRRWIHQYDSELARVLAPDGDGESAWVGDSTGAVRRVRADGTETASFCVSGAVVALWCPPGGGGLFAATYDDERYSVWHQGDDKPLLVCAGALNSDLSTFSIAGGRVFAMIKGDDALVWSLSTPGPAHALSAPDGGYTALCLSPDARRLAARTVRGAIDLWDMGTETRYRVLDDAPEAHEHWDTLGPLQFSPDGALLVDLWRELPGRLIDFRTSPPTILTIPEAPSTYRTSCFSTDNARLAITDLSGVVRFYDTAQGVRLHEYAARPAHTRSLCFALGNQRLFCCDDLSLNVWDVNPEADVRVLRVAGENFHTLAVAPDGDTLLAGGGRGVIVRLDARGLTDETPILNLGGVISSLAIAHDGHLFAAATQAGSAVLADLQQPQAAPLRLPHPRGVNSVAFSPDGKSLLTACDDGSARLWRVADGALEREFRFSDTRLPAAAFSPDGQQIAAAVRNGAVMVWGIHDAAAQTWAQPGRVAQRTVQFAPHREMLISGGAARLLNVWNTQSRKRIAGLTGHGQEIYCLEFSPTGEIIASGDAGGSIRLWDAELLCPLATLGGHTAAVMELRFSPDGRRLYSASLDGSVRTWDLGFYMKHVAGNVEMQLRRNLAAASNLEGMAAWRTWAEQTLHSPP